MENNVHKKTITDRMKLLLFLLVPIAVASMMTSLLVRESEETRRNEVIEKYVSTLNGDDLKASLKNIKFINYKRKVSLYFGDNLIIDNPTGEYRYEITKYHFYPSMKKVINNIFISTIGVKSTRQFIFFCFDLLLFLAITIYFFYLQKPF
jgi:hypothetical protein